MATTEHFYTGDGSTSSFGFTFPYLKNADVKVQLDAVEKTESIHYNISNTNIVFTSGNIPASGVDIHIFRLTDVDTPQAVFAAGSSIRAGDLNNNQTQNLYSNQEQTQLFRADRLKDSSITSNKIVDGTIVDGDINASAAIAGTKISPDFGSQNIVTTGTGATGNLGVTGNITVSGTVDGRDVASDGTKLDGIETAATADQTAAEIRTLVESASDSNVFTDADHTKLNGIETGATADQTNAEIRAAVEAASDSNVFTDADHTKLNGIETGATADQTASEIKTLIASSPLDSSHLAANSVGTSEIADAELTTLAGMQSGTASKLADSTALTADIADLNQIDGMAKETTITNDDTKFPTSGAVVDYVAAQIAPLGGLEVISNEVSFPNTQPASGVVISISDAGGTVFNGSGVSTTGRTVGGSTVTINGAPSSLNSETLVAGVGLMVSSTGAGQIYNYHKILGKEDDIKQLSDDINDFNARYRVGSSNPTSNNDSGDMFFNTSTGKMLVYNGVNSAWEEVQSIGNFFISTFSESFDGSRTAFTVSNAPTNAQQLIISINGVIQKPNSGTGQPSEGFTLSGSTVTFSSAIPSGSDYFVIVLGSTVNIGTPSNNTVGASQLQNGQITNTHIAANAAIDASKIANLSTDSITEGNSKAEVIGSGTANGEFKVGLQDYTYTGANKTALRMYQPSDGFNKLELFEENTTSNAALSIKHLYSGNGTSNLNFTTNNGSRHASIKYWGNLQSLKHYIAGAEKFSLGQTQSVFGTNLIPTADSTHDLGTNTRRWQNIYADTLYGDGSNLTGISTSPTADTGGAIFQNSQTISANHTIPVGSNGMSAGPVTVNNGISLTISNGSTYTIV